MQGCPHLQTIQSIIHMWLYAPPDVQDDLFTQDYSQHSCDICGNQCQWNGNLKHEWWLVMPSSCCVSLLIILRSKRDGWTHAPLMRIPCIEPAGEGWRLISLFDKDNGCVGVTTCRMCPQVFLCTGPRLFGLLLVGQVSNPQENLRWFGRKRWDDNRWMHIIIIHYRAAEMSRMKKLTLEFTLELLMVCHRHPKIFHMLLISCFYQYLRVYIRNGLLCNHTLSSNFITVFILLYRNIYFTILLKKKVSCHSFIGFRNMKPEPVAWLD